MGERVDLLLSGSGKIPDDMRDMLKMFLNVRNLSALKRH